MNKRNSYSLEAKEALEDLKAEFSRQLVLYNPNAGISVEKLVELTKDTSLNTSRL